MSDKELKTYIADIRKTASDIASDEVKSKKFLTDIGLLNREGKVKKQYRDICIQIDQD
ncbi:hypothetical protein [Mucilaginibacter celer]|uniref:hypothetical protein n=1 Tax=Mucilaginibacter celer TaxID=2305508 RepID=UPI0013CE5DF0|nr:hypothetical protein [Mucilaginibacter celer]